MLKKKKFQSSDKMFSLWKDIFRSKDGENILAPNHKICINFHLVLMRLFNIYFARLYVNKGGFKLSIFLSQNLVFYTNK